MLPSIQISSSARLRAVVFDMDGVIVDSHPAHRAAWTEFLHATGKNVSESELDFVMDGRRREDILAHFLGPLTQTQMVEYGRLKDELFWRATSDVVPIPGVLEFIESLNASGITMAVATSASASRTQSILSRLGLMARFDAVVTGDEVCKGKPDPYIYELACQRINCPPNFAVAVEDAASGIRAAKGAGLRCVGIAGDKFRDRLAAAGADCVVQDFADMTLAKFHCLLGIPPAQRPISECESQ